jgi:hypothetical protein
MKTLAMICAFALAQGTEGPAEEETPKGAPATGPEADAAKDLVTKYLNAVKAKKWADAKKMVHPETLKVIEGRKKRNGKEDHPMAPQAYEKTDFYLKDFKVKGVTVGAGGTFVVETAEDNYQVDAKGTAEGEMATYLVGKKDGKWWIADKKRGESFTSDSIKLGYKGYFDKPAPKD